MFKKLSIISASLIALSGNVSIEAMNFGAMRRFASVGLSQVVRTWPSFTRNTPVSLARPAFFGGSFLSFCMPPTLNLPTCVTSRFPEQQQTTRIPTLLLLPTRYCVAMPKIPAPVKKKRPAPLNFVEAPKEYEDQYCTSWIIKEREKELNIIQENMRCESILVDE